MIMIIYIYIYCIPTIPILSPFYPILSNSRWLPPIFET